MNTERNVLGHADVVVVGAGTAGVLAAIAAASRDVSVLLVEKNPRPGRKMTARGPGKRYLTNFLNPRSFLDTFGKGGRFLTPAIEAFSGARLVHILRKLNVELEVDEHHRVSPAGGRYADVQRALSDELATRNVRTQFNFSVDAIEHEAGARASFYVRDRQGRGFTARRVVIATGGLHMPESGSTGDGLQWARDLNHSVNPPAPALVGILVKGIDNSEVDGIAVPDVALELLSSQFRSPLANESGDIRFVDSGIAGTAAINLSNDCASVGRGQNLVVKVDFFPEATAEILQRSIEEAVTTKPMKMIADALSRDALPRALPGRLIEALIGASFPGLRSVKCNAFPTATRRLLAERLKGFELEVIGTEGFKKALATDGGVDVHEIDPKTLESKIVPALHFAGEVLDITGRYGGYNSQAAFATGFLAGESAAVALGGAGAGLPIPDPPKPKPKPKPKPRPVAAAKKKKTPAARPSKVKAGASTPRAASATKKKAVAKPKAAAAKAPAADKPAAKKPAAKKPAAKKPAAKKPAAKKPAAKKPAAKKPAAKKPAAKKPAAKKPAAKSASKVRPGKSGATKVAAAKKTKASATKSSAKAGASKSGRAGNSAKAAKKASKAKASTKPRRSAVVGGPSLSRSASKRGKSR